MQLSVREVAKLLDVSERKIYAWIKEGSLPAYYVNEQYRFNRAELLEWATARNMDVPTDLFANGDADAEQASFADALAEGGVFYGVHGTDKPSVLQAIVDAMQLPPNVNRELLFRVLVAREALGSTGIGGGIAIPHPRNPIVLHIDKAEICLCFLAHPINFGALDRKPVHTLFTLASPTVQDHLHLLSRLAYALRDPAFKALIMRRAPKEEILLEARKIEASLKPGGEGLRPFSPKRSRGVA